MPSVVRIHSSPPISPEDLPDSSTGKPRDASKVNGWLNRATKALALSHVTPHGLRSYFVTQARQSGLTDAEIAMLIGDKTGPAIIAAVYGDLRARPPPSASEADSTAGDRRQSRLIRLDAVENQGSASLAGKISGRIVDTSSSPQPPDER